MLAGALTNYQKKRRSVLASRSCDLDGIPGLDSKIAKRTEAHLSPVLDSKSAPHILVFVGVELDDLVTDQIPA
jgi:hypothetical protein